MISWYRWVIVAAGAFMGCVAIGAIFSLPVFLQPMAQATGWSRTGISSAMSLNFVAMGVASFGWGMAMDRIGPRIVLLLGGTLLGTGLVLASRASSVLEFQILYGCLVGAGGGAIFAPLMATVVGWFERQRSLAVSLVSAGMGVAPMTGAPFAARLVSTYDWRTSQLVIGIIVWTLLLPAALFIRRSPALHPGVPARSTAHSPVSAGSALRSPQLVVLALTYFTWYSACSATGWGQSRCSSQAFFFRPSRRGDISLPGKQGRSMPSPPFLVSLMPV